MERGCCPLASKFTKHLASETAYYLFTLYINVNWGCVCRVLDSALMFVAAEKNSTTQDHSIRQLMPVSHTQLSNVHYK